MRWHFYIRRRDYLTGEWKRSQLELAFEDYTGKKTYGEIWNKCRRQYPNFHTSQLRLERV